MLTISQKDLAQRLKMAPRTVSRLFKAHSKGRYAKAHVLSRLKSMHKGRRFTLVEVPELLTAEQYACLTGVSKFTVLRWVRTGRFPHYRIGDRGVRVWLDDVESVERKR